MPLFVCVEAPRRRAGMARPLVERRRMELLTGLEPVTSSLPRKCSTTELQQQGIHPRVPVGRPGLSARRARQGQRPRGGGASSDSPGRGRGRGRAEVERVGGIEPPCAAWKAAVLPLNYTRQWVPPLPQEHARPGVAGALRGEERSGFERAARAAAPPSSRRVDPPQDAVPRQRSTGRPGAFARRLSAAVRGGGDGGGSRIRTCEG